MPLPPMLARQVTGLHTCLHELSSLSVALPMLEHCLLALGPRVHTTSPWRERAATHLSSRIELMQDDDWQYCYSLEETQLPLTWCTPVSWPPSSPPHFPSPLPCRCLLGAPLVHQQGAPPPRVGASGGRELALLQSEGAASALACQRCAPPSILGLLEG